MPILVVERGNDKGLTVKVEPQRPCVVGRENPHASLKLSDPMASRQHFQIAAANGAFKIRDMKSRNGTLLNDEKLHPETDTDIKIGDKIQVGETIFSFLSDEKEEGAGGLIGKTIGGYRLLERVGRGGMGTVYKAEQMSLNREVALKVLSAKLLSDPVFVQKFVAEAKAAGGLNHPNIVQVFDVGSDRGVYYFSMEFMDHGSVGDVVAKEGPVPWERALEMLTDAARGLVFAEKRGIVHRDIKPDNLMLTSEGIVKIGDLGLAKKADEGAGEGGQIFGTPHFIAPEQAQGKAVDHRADIYSLGATFYRVLSGKTPFTGENVKEILIKQVQEEPVPIQKLVHDLPAELSAIVGKMMRKKVEDRYRSAQGLIEDLERVRVMYHLEAHGQAVSARRSKAMAIVFALVALGLGGIVWYLIEHPRVLGLPEKPKEPDKAPIIDNTPPPTPPEELADRELRPLTKEENGLLRELGGGPAQTWKQGEARWLALAQKLEALSKKYAETPAGKEAGQSGKRISDAVTGAKRNDQQQHDKASADFTALITEVEKRVNEGRYADAARFLATRWASLLETWKEFLPADAAGTVKEEFEAIAATAEERAKPLLKDLEEGSNEFPGTNYLETLKRVFALRTGLVVAVEAKDAASVRLAKVAADVRDAIAKTRSQAYEAAASALDQDRNAFFKGYLAIRRWAPAEGGDPAAESPFFAYRWEDALQRWDAILKEMRTRPFRERVQTKVRHYNRCKHLFETIAARIRSKEIEDPDFPKPVERAAGSDIKIDAQQRDKTTTEGLWTFRTATRQKAFVEFRAMTPQELYETFLKKGQGMNLSTEDHMDLAVFLAEAGCGDAAWAELGLADSTARGAAPDAALHRWVEDEGTIWVEYYAPGGIKPAFDAYVDFRDQAKATQPAEVERRRAALEQRIREMMGAERFHRTDFSILHHSFFGAEGQPPEKVLPDAAVQEVLRTLGGDGEVSLPPEDPKEKDKPPPEAPAGGAQVAPKDAGKTPSTDRPGDPGTERPK